jgi:hypothetical protein
VKKNIVLSGLMIFCFAIVIGFASQGNAMLTVDSTNCTVSGCHAVAAPGTSDDPAEEHNRHPIGTQGTKGGTIACASCHKNGAGEKGDVYASSCSVCHMEKCELSNDHDPDRGAVCLSCHPECAPASTTTTSIADSGSCAAEAVYGGNSYEVLVLRTFRDEVLSKTAAGRTAIKMYYKMGPMAVTAIEKNKTFKNSIKKVLDTLIPVIDEQLTK